MNSKEINKFILAVIFCFFTLNSALPQVAINTDGAQPNTKSILDVASTSLGVLLPRMTEVQRTAIASPPQGLLVFQIDGGVNAGLYYATGVSNNWTLIFHSNTTAITGTGSQNYIPYWTGTNALAFTGMYWDNTNSRLGIGTTAPGYILDVYASVNSTYAAQIKNNSSAGSGLSVIAGGNPGNGSNKLLSLKDGGSNEKFTVLDNGKVGIGTTSPTNMLTINGSATTNPPTMEIQYGGVTKGYLWYDSGSDFIGVGRGSAANSITLRTSQLNYNSAYCTGTTWVDASDARLKRDIKPMTNYGLSTVMQLKPVTYYFKADKTNHPEVGFIAQDMQKIIPEVVSGTEGDISKGETLGLSYGNLVPVLTKAIQEQQVRIETQQNKIETQQNKIDDLEIRLSKLEHNNQTADNASFGGNISTTVIVLIIGIGVALFYYRKTNNKLNNKHLQ